MFVQLRKFTEGLDDPSLRSIFLWMRPSDFVGRSYSAIPGMSSTADRILICSKLSVLLSLGLVEICRMSLTGLQSP